jgi:hypothetical protein
MVGPVSLELAVALGAVAVISVFVAAVNAIGKRRELRSLRSEEEVEAAIGLHSIRRRLQVAKTRSEIHRDSDSLRQQMMEEMLNDDRRP